MWVKNRATLPPALRSGGLDGRTVTVLFFRPYEHLRLLIVSGATSIIVVLVHGVGSMNRFRRPAFTRACVAALALLIAAASFVATGTAARAADTYWQSGTSSALSWSGSSNWSNGVPDATTNALTTATGANILLGSAAQAKTFFVDGPVGGESTLTSGTLTLADQLWINVDTGTAGGTILRLYDGGSAPVSVTANNATLGADPGKQGNIILDSQSGGNVSLNVTNTLNIGYDGSGSYVYSFPFIGTTSGSVSITADTIQVSGLSTAGVNDVNSIGTYNVNHSVTATNLNLGVAGKQGGAENFGGTWNVGNTALGGLVTSGSNYLTITDSGTFTNTGAFTVGVNGSNNSVHVGYADGYGTTNGTLLLTGSNDLVIGSASTADNNQVNVALASSLSANGNIVVGIDGTNGTFELRNGSTATSGGVRLGVNAGADGNQFHVYGGSNFSTNGTVRVGDKGSNNFFNIASGGTATLTGAGKNFYVGYDKSAQGNAVFVSDAGSTLSVKATGADVVVSANVTGTTGDSSLNVLAVADGGVVDANRVLVGNGGQIWGFDGTIKGDTLVGAGGTIAPGISELGLPLGSLSFLGNVDLSQNGGGTFAVDLGASGTSDFIDVSGTLSLAGSTLDLTVGVQDHGLAYIIAHYGTLVGTFATINGLPGPGWYVDYYYQRTNQIAIVSDAISSVPEIDPASFGSALAMLLGSLGLLERRRRR